MSPAWPLEPKRRIGIIILLGLIVGAYAFLSGPSGLVSILVRRQRVRHLEAEIAGLEHKIAARSAQRDWLANPDTARMLARKLLAPDPAEDSTAAPR